MALLRPAQYTLVDRLSRMILQERSSSDDSDSDRRQLPRTQMSLAGMKKILESANPTDQNLVHITDQLLKFDNCQEWKKEDQVKDSSEN